MQQPDCREPFLSCCQFAESLRKKARARGQEGLARGEALGGLGDRPGHRAGQNGPLLIPMHRGPPALQVLEEEELMDEDDVPVRSFFPENWLWRVAEVDRSLQ